MTIIDSYSAGAIGKALDSVNSAILIVGDAARQLPEAQAETFANHLANTIDRLREGRDLLEDVLYPAEVEEEEEPATAFGEVFEKAAHRAAPEGLRAISADDLLSMLRERASEQHGAEVFETTLTASIEAAADALRSGAPGIVGWREDDGWRVRENLSAAELKDLRKFMGTVSRVKQQHESVESAGE